MQSGVENVGEINYFEENWIAAAAKLWNLRKIALTKPVSVALSLWITNTLFDCEMINGDDAPEKKAKEEEARVERENSFFTSETSVKKRSQMTERKAGKGWRRRM